MTGERDPEGKIHLRRGWRRTRRYLDLLQVLLVVLDKDGRVRLVNRKSLEVLGRSKEEVIGRDWFRTCLPPRARKSARDLFRRLMAGEPDTVAVRETPILTADGEERSVAWRQTVMTDDAGVPVGVISSGEGLTERRLTEAALEASEARNAAILESAVEGIITIDEEGRIESFNPAAARIFGYEPEEVIGVNVRRLMPDPDAKAHDDHLNRYRETGERRIIGSGREVVGMRKDGTPIPLELSIGEVRLGDRRIFTGLLRDVTPMKRMQEEMLRTRNLAAIGEMAASLAHEIKNPLAGISSVIQVLRDDFAPDDRRRDLFDELLGLVSRLDKTVKDLLIFARPWTPERRPYRVADVARHVAAGTRRDELFAGVRFRFEGDQETEVPVDPQLLEQVFWNLFLNSAQAMGEGGEILCRFRRGADALEVTVSDEGPGIPEEIREKVFLPFATTKARGTGLGLAICRKIMEVHGGAIRLDSGPGEPAQVHLTFPRDVEAGRPD